MRILLVLLITNILNAELKLPTNFITDFNQIITNEKGKIIKYYGKLYFKQDIYINNSELNQTFRISKKNFKWEYKKPTKKEVCSDGIEIIVIDHDLEQISKYLIDEGLDLEKILKLAKPLSLNDYKAIYKDKEYLITLDNNQRLKKIFYIDNLDNRVKITFSDMEYNISNFNTLNLKCPINPEYDIIEE